MITLKHVANYCEGNAAMEARFATYEVALATRIHASKFPRVSRLMKSPSPLQYILQDFPLSNLKGAQYNTRAFATLELPVVYNLKDHA
jgi:hypothetical protein